MQIVIAVFAEEVFTREEFDGDGGKQATEQELTDLTLLRMKRDSLKVQWDLLGAKIKYIRQKQKEIAK